MGIQILISKRNLVMRFTTLLLSAYILQFVNGNNKQEQHFKILQEVPNHE